MGDSRLLRVASPVCQFDTPELRELVRDMLDTMRHAGGLGLAAPQLGENLQVVTFGSAYFERANRVPETVLVNPSIVPVSTDVEERWEGCLSVPGMRGAVRRFSVVRYRGFDEHGKPIDRVAEGLHARIVQHECDHLVGTLYPTLVADYSKLRFKRRATRWPDCSTDFRRRATEVA